MVRRMFRKWVTGEARDAPGEWLEPTDPERPEIVLPDHQSGLINLDHARFAFCIHVDAAVLESIPADALDKNSFVNLVYAWSE